MMSFYNPTTEELIAVRANDILHYIRWPHRYRFMFGSDEFRIKQIKECAEKIVELADEIGE